MGVDKLNIKTEYWNGEDWKDFDTVICQCKSCEQGKKWYEPEDAPMYLLRLVEREDAI